MNRIRDNQLLKFVLLQKNMKFFASLLSTLHCSATQLPFISNGVPYETVWIYVFRATVNAHLRHCLLLAATAQLLRTLNL